MPPIQANEIGKSEGRFRMARLPWRIEPRKANFEAEWIPQARKSDLCIVRLRPASGSRFSLPEFVCDGAT